MMKINSIATLYLSVPDRSKGSATSLSNCRHSSHSLACVLCSRQKKLPQSSTLPEAIALSEALPQQQQQQVYYPQPPHSRARKDPPAPAAPSQKSSHCVGSYYYPANSQGFAGKYPPPSFSRVSAIGTAMPIPITVLDPGKSQSSPVSQQQKQQADEFGDEFPQKGQQQQQQPQGGFVVSSHIFIPQKLKGPAKTPEALYKELFPDHPVPPSIFLTSE